VRREENLIEVDVVASARHPLLIQDLRVVSPTPRARATRKEQPGAVSACFVFVVGRESRREGERKGERLKE
jgi:hypothetical protein